MSKHPVIELAEWFVSVSEGLTYENITDIALHAPQYYAAWWKKLFYETPEHVFIETTLVLFIIWLFFIRETNDPKKTTKQPKLSSKEKEWLVESWQPEPLVPDITPLQAKIIDSSPVIEAVDGLEINVQGISKSVLNVSSYDFLGLSAEPSVLEAARKALEKYGCGSCGPRGFYGSIDQHLLFEQAIAKFMRVQEAILYSDGSTAVSSTIPAFSKKGDLLIVDEGCSEPVRTGATLSRSTVHYFKHNDMSDLEAILASIAKEDKRIGTDTTQQRRFIVVEGVYRNTGAICPLPEVLALGKKYFYRLILDESISFGTMGRSGRGLTEHFGISASEIDILTLSLDTTLASIGGICLGSREIVDHQRLSGAGYCFSASAPPFLSAAAIESLHTLESNPGYLVALKENTAKCISALKVLEPLGLTVLNKSGSQSSYPSPVIHLVLDPAPSSRDIDEDMIIRLYKQCLSHGVGVALSRFPLGNKKTALRPSIRLCGSSLWSDKDIKRIVQGLTSSIKLVKKSYGK